MYARESSSIGFKGGTGTLYKTCSEVEPYIALTSRRSGKLLMVLAPKYSIVFPGDFETYATLVNPLDFKP
jgi:hypothetical protein